LPQRGGGESKKRRKGFAGKQGNQGKKEGEKETNGWWVGTMEQIRIRRGIPERKNKARGFGKVLS